MFMSASKHFSGSARNTCEYTTEWSYRGMNRSSSKGSGISGQPPRNSPAASHDLAAFCSVGGRAEIPASNAEQSAWPRPVRPRDLPIDGRDTRQSTNRAVIDQTSHCVVTHTTGAGAA